MMKRTLWKVLASRAIPGTRSPINRGEGDHSFEDHDLVSVAESPASFVSRAGHRRSFKEFAIIDQAGSLVRRSSWEETAFEVGGGWHRRSARHYASHGGRF